MIPAPSSRAAVPRIEILDPLRGLAALSVAWFHFTQNNHGLPDGWLKSSGTYGWLGVEAFFVISGFVIPYALHGGGYTLRAYPRFVAKRLTRLEPPYLMSIVIAVALSYLTTLWPGFEGRPFEVSATQVLLHVGYLAPFFGVDWLVPAYWTLALEFQFYLLIGLVFPLILMPGGWLRTAGLLGLIGLSVALPSKLLVLHWLPLFALGMVTFHYHSGFVRRAGYVTLLAATSVWAFALFGLTVTLVALATALCIGFLRGEAGLFGRLGWVSYSLYLLHVPIGERVVLLANRLSTAFGVRAAAVFAAVVVSVAAAGALYRWVERPAQQWASRIRYEPVTAAVEPASVPEREAVAG